MANIFVSSSHSFIDVITNSSSELFVSNTDHSLGFIKELIEETIATYNKYNNESNTFENLFGEMFIYDGTNLESWYKHNYGVHPKKGDIILISKGDNSIPWGIMETLENSFGMYRYHIG